MAAGSGDFETTVSIGNEDVDVYIEFSFEYSGGRFSYCDKYDETYCHELPDIEEIGIDGVYVGCENILLKLSVDTIKDLKETAYEKAEAQFC